MLEGDEDRKGRQRPGERAAGGARASSGAGEAGGFCTEAGGVGRFCSVTVTSCRVEGVCRALRTEADGGRCGEGNPRGRGPIHQLRGAERETRGAAEGLPMKQRRAREPRPVHGAAAPGA